MFFLPLETGIGTAKRALQFTPPGNLTHASKGRQPRMFEHNHGFRFYCRVPISLSGNKQFYP